MKTIIFHILMTFKGLIFLAFKLLIGFTMLAFISGIVMYFMNKDTKSIQFMLVTGGSTVFLTFLRYMFIKLLFWLKPDDGTELTIFY